MCESENAQLVRILDQPVFDLKTKSFQVSLQSEAEAKALTKFIQRVNRRRTRFEYWTAGNDIDKENKWVWSSDRQIREPVPDFGWLDQPFPSAEENCLTWSITITNR